MLSPAMQVVLRRQHCHWAGSLRETIIYIMLGTLVYATKLGEGHSQPQTRVVYLFLL
jgi:hypothetical protein